jgi:phospholipase/lecithinase/hemolysin
MGRANGQASGRGNVKMIRKKLSGAAFALATCCSSALLGAYAAHAADFSAEYVFGDSLSDVGNVYLATTHAPTGQEPVSPYVGGQFSNGPVWAQDLAGRLGLPPLTPSLAGGTDYAFGGATTGSTFTNNSEVPSLEQQVNAFLASPPPSKPSDALYTFSIGANDLFAILGGQTGGLTPAQAAGAAAQVVADQAAALAAAGAKKLVLFDVPDLGQTPGVTALGPIASAAASALSGFFDQAVLQDLAPVEAAGLTVYDLKTFALIDAAVQNPGAFGFSNVTDPCWTGGFTGGPGSLCSTDPAVQDKYLFWDGVHPTAAGHLLVADSALRAMGLPVPEPSTWAMLLVGFGGLGFAGYRARGRATA